MFSVKVVYVLLVPFVLFAIIISCESSLDNASYLKPYLNKRYKLATSDDNFEDVMKALGVGLILRNLAHLARPVIELTENNGEYTLTQESTFKNMVIKFRIGEEFEEMTPDNRVVRSIITQDHNKLIHVQRGDQKTTTITRIFDPRKVRVVVQVGDIVSVRTYDAE